MSPSPAFDAAVDAAAVETAPQPADLETADVCSTFGGEVCEEREELRGGVEAEGVAAVVER